MLKRPFPFLDFHEEKAAVVVSLALLRIDGNELLKLRQQQQQRK